MKPKHNITKALHLKLFKLKNLAGSFSTDILLYGLVFKV